MVGVFYGYVSYVLKCLVNLLFLVVCCSYWLMKFLNIMLCGSRYVFLEKLNGVFGCMVYSFGCSFCCSLVFIVLVIIRFVWLVMILLKIVMLFGYMWICVCFKCLCVNFLLVFFGLIIVCMFGWLICVSVWYFVWFL